MGKAEGGGRRAYGRVHLPAGAVDAPAQVTFTPLVRHRSPPLGAPCQRSELEAPVVVTGLPVAASGQNLAVMLTYTDCSYQTNHFGGSASYACDLQVPAGAKGWKCSPW